jgi:hypothetical protein
VHVAKRTNEESCYDASTDDAHGLASDVAEGLWLNLAPRECLACATPQFDEFLIRRSGVPWFGISYRSQKLGARHFYQGARSPKAR